MIARLRGVAGAMLAGLMVYGCISIATQTGVRPDPPEPRGAPGTPAARAPRAVTPGDLTVSDYVRDLTAQRDTLDTIIQQYQGTTPPVPTATLSASPGSVQTGGASTLTWSSTNATGCTASGAWSGAKASSGSESRTNLQANSTYSLACAGAGGTSQAASTTVTVTAIPPPTAPTAMLSAAPTSMQPGGSRRGARRRGAGPAVRRRAGRRRSRRLPRPPTSSRVRGRGEPRRLSRRR